MPTLEASGHFAASLCAGSPDPGRLIPSGPISGQPARPSAAEGFTAKPWGRVTTVSFRWAVAGCLPSSSGAFAWGMWRFTARPVGESEVLVSGLKATLGSNGGRSQLLRPAGRPPGPLDCALAVSNASGSSTDFTLSVQVSGPVQEVGRERNGIGAASLLQPSIFSPFAQCRFGLRRGFSPPASPRSPLPPTALPCWSES